MGNTNSAVKNGLQNGQQSPQSPSQQQQQQQQQPQSPNVNNTPQSPPITSSTSSTSLTDSPQVPDIDSRIEHLNREVPTLKSVLEELKDKKVTVEVLETLFVKCCFMGIENFFDKYPSEDTLKCQYETRNKSAWFFTCQTCTKSNNSCFCAPCFFNGPHIDENHIFTVAENMSAVCDCGNAESIKPHGFCIDHQNVDEDNQIKQFRSVQPFVQKDLHLFFRYLFAYLHRFTAVQADFDANKSNIEVILDWLSFLASRSSILIHVISQEVSSQQLDHTNFDINSPLPLPYSTNDSLMLESHHFLSYIFRKPTLLEYFLDLLTLLIDNHRLFRVIFFDEYLKNYEDIFRPRDTVSTEIMILIGSFYLETQSILIPFTTGYSSANFLELIFKTHIIYMKMLEPFYKSDKAIEKDVMLQTDMSCVPKLFLNKQVGKYFLDHENTVRQYLEFAYGLHNFTSPQFVDPTITTTCFLVALEHKLMSSIKNLVATQKIDTPELPLRLVKDILTQLAKLTYPPLFERNGLNLPHQDFFQKFKYSEIPVHFPLYRMLANIILEGNHHLIKDLKTVFPKDDVVNMVNTILLFRVCYISYDPSFDPKESLLKSQQSTEFFTDSTMMCDLFSLQMGLMLLGPRHYLHTFFNVITSVDIYNNSTAFNELFALLTSSIQIRGTTHPNDDEIRYHLIQIVSSGFFILENLKFGFIFGDVPTEKLEKILDEVSVKKDQVRVLKDQYWKDVDLFYPFLSLKYKNLLKTKTLQNYKDYQKRNELPDEFPIPPKLTTLHTEFHGANVVFDDPTLFEIVYAVVMDFLHNDYIGYDNSFDLLPVIRLLLKKTDFVINDFLYLLALGLKSFKDEYLVKIASESDKQDIQNTINEFFKLEDKTTFVPPKPLSLYNVMRTFNVELLVGTKTPLSLLDILIELWQTTKQSLNAEKKSVLRFIFSFVAELNENFATYLKSKNVEFTDAKESQEELIQKQTIRDKRKKFLEKFQQQQSAFLSAANANGDELSTTPGGSPFLLSTSPSSPLNIDINNNNNTTEKKDEEKKDDEKKEDEKKDEETKEGEKKEDEEKKEEVKKDEEKVVEKIKSEDDDDHVDVNNNNNLIKDNQPLLPPPNISLLKIKEITEEDEHTHAPAEDNTNKDECCIICQYGKEQELLYSIGYIDITSTSQLNSKLEIERHINDERLPDNYVNFLDEYFYQEINPGSLPYLPNKGDDPALFAAFLFYRSASTYITSCNHNVHQTCLRKLHPFFDDGFACPLCSLPSNIIIPLTVDNTLESLEARKLFYTALCKFDFFLFMTKENSHVIERYMWKYVLQNIETLEIKSRKTSLYSDEPYYVMKQTEFNKELATLKKLFTVIMACNVPATPEGRLPMESNYVFLMDPFISSTYQVYLSNCEPFNCVANGYIIYLFDLIVLSMMKQQPTVEITKKTLAAYISTLKAAPLSEELMAEFNDQLLPYLRKMYLFREFYMPSDDSREVISLEAFSDLDKMRAYLNVNPIDKFIQHMDFTNLIDQYCSLTSTPKGSQFVGVYPPPCSFSNMPKFIDLPERYIDFLRMNLDGGHCDHCKSLKKQVCMFCGLKFCASDNCKGSSYIHSYRCPNTPFGLFMCIDNPLVKVLKEEHGKTSNFYPYGIYLNPHGVESLVPDTSLTLSQKRLKVLYKQWLNSNNSRKFN